MDKNQETNFSFQAHIAIKFWVLKCKVQQLGFGYQMNNILDVD